MFEIEKNISVKSENQGYSKYPWWEMEIGDSFKVDGYSYAKQNGLGTNGRDWAKRNNPEVRFKTRKEGDSVRITRVK